MPTSEERRAERAAEAQKHIATMNIVFADQTKASIGGAVVYKEGVARKLELPDPRFEKTRAQTLRRDSARAVLAIEGDKPAVLDFASFTIPGGGYERGAWAQEEALCAASNLYPVLDGCRSIFYDDNYPMRRGGLFTDKCMYLPDVMFGEDNAIRPVGVIVCAAPHRRHALENGRDALEIDNDLERRVEAVMRVAAVQGVDALVLGAFGCGVFANDPTQVAGLFKDWLDAHPGIFADVVFAVPGGPNFDPFEAVFPRIVEREQRPAAVDADGEEDGDGEDWRAYAACGGSDDGLGADAPVGKEDWRQKLARFKS